VPRFAHSTVVDALAFILHLSRWSVMTTLVPMSAGHKLEATILPPPVRQATSPKTPEAAASAASVETSNTAAQPPKKLAVFGHPWSWLGGKMSDPVLDSLVEPFHNAGYHILFFNSRGVGKSSGWSSFTGSGETEDFPQIVQWAMKEVGPGITRLVIMGYSHSALIASTFHELNIPGVKTSHILLSYPLGYRPVLTLFNSGTYADALSGLLASYTSDVLVVYGDSDEFTSVTRYETWVAELQAKAEGRLQVKVIEDADHFWRWKRHMGVLRDVIGKWLKEH